MRNSPGSTVPSPESRPPAAPPGGRPPGTRDSGLGTIVVLALLGAGCNLRPPDWQTRGYTREELEAGPTYHAMKGAILNDVRIWRQLDRKLDEGTLECPGIVREQATPKCAKDMEELVHFPLKEDLPDQPYRVDEEAYYCPLESVYFYHYSGGPRKRNVWLGPYKINRPARKLDDDQH